MQQAEINKGRAVIKKSSCNKDLRSLKQVIRCMNNNTLEDIWINSVCLYYVFTEMRFLDEPAKTVVLILSYLWWNYGSAVRVWSQFAGSPWMARLPAESVCCQWKQCANCAVQLVCGSLSLVLLMVRQPSAEKGEVIMYKELKRNSTLQLGFWRSAWVHVSIGCKLL